MKIVSYVTFWKLYCSLKFKSLWPMELIFMYVWEKRENYFFSVQYPNTIWFFYMDPGIQMVHRYPYTICSKDHLTILQCVVTGYKSKDSLCLCHFIDSLFHSIGLFTLPCTKATMIKIRLEVRLYKSSNFVHPQDCLGYSRLFVFS